MEGFTLTIQQENIVQTYRPQAVVNHRFEGTIQEFTVLMEEIVQELEAQGMAKFLIYTIECQIPGYTTATFDEWLEIAGE